MSRPAIPYSAVFYSLTVVMGLHIALAELDAGRIDNFGRFCALVWIVFGLELFSNWYTRRNLPQTHLTSADRFARLSAILYHLVLPSALFISIAGFTFFNRQQHIRLLLLLFTFTVFCILFINIRSHYERRFADEGRTDYIYDIIKFLIFFCSANSLINIASASPSFFPPLAGVGLMAMALLILLQLRYRRLEMYGVVLALICSSVIVLSLMLFMIYTPMPVMQLSLLAAISFYISSAFVHHQMRRDMTASVALEYVAVIAIAIAILYGLT